MYPFSRRKEIIALLEEHITENIVKVGCTCHCAQLEVHCCHFGCYAQIGNEYYRQVVGIPQGSVLSAILCSFFYGDLERKNFRFTDDDECVSPCMSCLV